MPVKLDVDWDAVRKAIELDGMTIAEASLKFEVKPNTIQMRVYRESWILPLTIKKSVQKRLELATEKAIAKITDGWLERGERHRETAFKVASESVKKFKAKAPKNFRELEAADKIARRAAGLDTAEVNTQTLIQINERMEAYDEPQPIEATLLPPMDAAISVLNNHIPEAEQTDGDDQPDDEQEQS